MVGQGLDPNDAVKTLSEEQFKQRHNEEPEL
jgi:hypothetical protein